MAEYDAYTAYSDDEEDADEELDASTFKQLTVVLIDGGARMLEPCALPGTEFAGLSWLRAALRTAASLLRAAAVGGLPNEAAVAFFNVEKAASRHGVGRVHELQPLGGADVERILQLETYTDADFAAAAGPAPPGAGEAVSNALAHANLALDEAARGGGARVRRAVMVFTRDEAPAADPNGAPLTQARVLAANGAALQLVTLVPPGAAFSLEPFWAPLLAVFKAARPAGAAASTGGSAAVAAASLSASPALSAAAAGGDDDDDDEAVSRIESLVRFVRRRAYRKRALTAMRFTLAPGLALGVRLYAVIHPAAKQPPVPLWGATNEPLVAASAYVDERTGAEYERAALLRYYPKEESSRLPRVYVTSEEMADVKAPLPKGLRLLGFRPAGALRPHHQLRPPTFAYPDERGAPGSAAAFAALHGAMVGRGVVALCVLVRSPSAEPRLVAALPQEEAVGEAGGQVEPPGLWLVYLPWADELRRPEADPAVAGAPPPAPPAAAVDAAAALVRELQLGDDFGPDAIPNPHLQRHYEGLEALALGRDPPAAPPRDEAVPDADAFAAAAPLVQAFKDAVWGPGYAGDLEPPAGGKAAGAKRKADAGAAEAQVAALGDLKALAAAGGLGTLTNDALKAVCRAAGLPLGGKKADLVARVAAHLDAQ